jgi:SGNH domain (fused to AT3 domains)
MIAILGDSHASMIAHQLAVALSPSGYSLIEFSDAACPPAPGLDIRAPKGKGCAEYNDRVRQRLSRGDIKMVVMVARWSQYVHREPFNNLEGGSDNWTSYATAVDSVQISTSEHERIAEVGRLYAQSVEQLLRDGVRVVLVYPLPEVGWNVPKEKARRMMAGVKDSITTSHEAFLKRNAVTYAAFDQLADSPNLIRVKPEQVLCDSFTKDRCVAELEDNLLYRDGNHLDEIYGVPLIAKQIVQAMLRHGWLSRS